MTVLLVDDDETFHRIWEHALRAHFTGMVFKYAKSLQEAIQEMHKPPPTDLVLLDMNLPPYTASETAAGVPALREINPRVSIMAVSGMQHDELESAIAGVAVEVIASKHEIETRDELCKLVKQALALKKTSSGKLLNMLDDATMQGL